MNLEKLVTLQQPVWPDPEAIADVRASLETMPGLVRPQETEDLHGRLAHVADGRGFIVQAGPCAESFSDTPEDVFSLARALKSMQRQISEVSGIPTTNIMRLAGQFCKPRSSDTETVNGTVLPSFRGELVNSPDFTREARTPDPQRLLRGYQHAQHTLDLLREMSAQEAFTAHEALLLDYELPLIEHHQDKGLLSSSAHFLWIGDRTRNLDGAHVKLCQMVDNPVGVKIGPGTTPDEVTQLCERLNPGRIAGRLSLIMRLGASSIDTLFESIIDAVTSEEHSVIWVVDPMHGNTVTAVGGKKTRHLSTIKDEIVQFFRICNDNGVWPGGIHLEMSGQEVTECLGDGVTELDSNYTTKCDPRISGSQSIEIGRLTGQLLAETKDM